MTETKTANTSGHHESRPSIPGESGVVAREGADFSIQELVLAGTILTAIALLLRLPLLGSTFSSSDQVSLATRIVMMPGYSWMIHEHYGIAVSMLVKLSAGLVSLLGITVTEFWWKLPIALVGSLGSFVAYVFLRRFQRSWLAAAFGGVAIAVLPLHVMQSRYLWGHEVIAVLSLTLALWALLRFLRSPEPKSALLASLLSGIYLVSHGYIVPFAVCVGLLAWYYGPDDRGSFRQFSSGVRTMWAKFVWVAPALFLPLYSYPLQHAARKPKALGFYLVDYGPGFVSNIGWPMTAFCLSGVAVAFFVNGSDHKLARVLGTCGLAYLLPLFLVVPPNTTLIRGYMLIGSYLLVLCAAVVLGMLAKRHRKTAAALGITCLLLTSAGTVETVFGRDRLIDVAGVEVERGVSWPDPGSKAAGFIVQEFVRPQDGVLAVHKSVELDNYIYYFRRRHFAFYDLTTQQSLRKLRELKEKVSVVICGISQVPAMEKASGFTKTTVLKSEGKPRMWIYAREHVDIPTGDCQIEQLNERFEQDFSWNVNLIESESESSWTKILKGQWPG